MEGGDCGGFDGIFGGDKPGGHRPTTAGERVVILWLSRMASLLLAIGGFAGALFIDDPERFRACLVVGTLGVVGLLILWVARRLGLV